MIHGVSPALPPRSLSTHPRRAPRPDAPTLALMERIESEMALALGALLDRKAGRLAIVSRVGSDLSRLRFEGEAPYYTHAGFAVRDAKVANERSEDGEDERAGVSRSECEREGDAWRIHHLVNTHEGPLGHLYTQTLTEFFQDDPFAYRVSVVVPRPNLQEAVADILCSPERQALYEPAYSRIAYPYSTRYQNSNQWVAELIGAARSGEVTRTAVQRFLLAEGALRPSVLRLAPIVMELGAAVISRNTGFADHPLSNRLRGRFPFLLPAAIAAYLAATDEMIAYETVELPVELAAPSGARTSAQDLVDAAARSCTPRTPLLPPRGR